MNKLLDIKLLIKAATAAGGLVVSGASFAQGATPPTTPGSQPSDPSAASTPTQRAQVKSPAAEASPGTGSTSPSAASTPQQKQQLTKKHKTKKAATTPPGN
jgi:hypothetical protein